MAHNIHFNEQTTKHSFFSVNEKPWHGLGQIVTEYPASKQALEYAGLNFGVEKRELFTLNKTNDTTDLKVSEYYATVRTDTQAVLGVVGKQYEVVQNEDAFQFFDAIVQGEGILYETAGALGKGERIFITAKLPNYIKVGKEDLIEQYLFLTTSHDGSGSIMAAFTPVRIVCKNTLNAAMRNKSNSIKIRHTANAKDRLEQAHELMGITNQLSAAMETLLNSWTKVRITDEAVLKLIQLALVPNKEVLHNIKVGKEDELSATFTNMCNNAFEYAMTSPSQQLETTKGTLFGAYNAVTGYLQNVRNYKSEEVKLKSLLFGGTGQQRAQAAFNLCADYMSKGADAFLLN